MNLNNFYVLVDTHKKIVTNNIQKLPINWQNISYLPGLSDEELCDLKWAGHDHLGWINIHSEKIKDYTSSPENLELNKNTFKNLIAEIRKEKQESPIYYQSARVKPDTKTLYALFVLKEKSSVNFKCLDGYHTFNSGQIKELCDIIDSNVQKYFDIEMDIYKQIDACQCISDFFNVNYDF
jgi:hypothetical protein